MYILGISVAREDSAAALILDGEIIAAAEEARCSRVQQDYAYPQFAIQTVLQIAGIGPEKVDQLVSGPATRNDQIVPKPVPPGVRGLAQKLPAWLRGRLFGKSSERDQPDLSSAAGQSALPLLKYADAHRTQAAAAYYPSPFERALVLTTGGLEETAACTAAIGTGHTLQLIQQSENPHSLGLLYARFASYCGFPGRGGDDRLMGLAPYGQPRFAGLIRKHLIDLNKGGSFDLNAEYLHATNAEVPDSGGFEALFGVRTRIANAPIEIQHMDLAASIQRVTEQLMLQWARLWQKQTGERLLCLGGSLAGNGAVNSRLANSGLFERIWIQPARHAAGAAVGAALAFWHGELQQPRPPLGPRADRMLGTLLGPGYEDSQIKSMLQAQGAVFEQLETTELLRRTASDLAEEQAVGWFQGRMEYGEHALGARSILADARSARMQSLLNLKVNFRPDFQPFAAMILAERAPAWFELDQESPYLLRVAALRKMHRRQANPQLSGLQRLDQVLSTLPAITHVDFTARIQTVTGQADPRLHELLCEFERQTGFPVLINAPLQLRDEPLVCTPEQALRCFMGSHLDRLVLGNCYLRKEEQPIALLRDYSHLLPAD